MRKALDGRARMGDPVTKQEKHAYEVLRGAGMSPEAAALRINRSKSWAYNYEKEQRAGAVTAPRGPVPKDDLSDAVGLIIAERTGHETQAFRIVDRFGAGILPFLTQVSWFFATNFADRMNDDLRLLFEDTPLAQELEDQPITAEDVLKTIPVAMRKHLAGENPRVDWMPPRAEAWFRRIKEIYPDLQELDSETRDALEADDPDSAMRDLRKSIYERQAS